MLAIFTCQLKPDESNFALIQISIVDMKRNWVIEFQQNDDFIF